MNFVGKHLNLIGIFLLTIFGAAAATLYLDVPARLQNTKPKATAIASPQYACPMHSEVVSAKAGNCSKCGMTLVLPGQAKVHAAPVGHEECAMNAEHESGCCAKKSASGCAMNFELPPGHPPIDGYHSAGPPSPATNHVH